MPRFRVVNDLPPLELDVGADDEDDAVDIAVDEWISTVHRWIADGSFDVRQLGDADEQG